MRTSIRDLKRSAVVRRRVAAVCSAFSCVCALWLAAGSAQAAPSVDAVLSRMAQADKSAEYTATITFKTASGTQSMRVWRDGAKRRLEWVEPTLRKGDVLVDDGLNTWLYLRAENSTIQTKSAKQRGWGVGTGTQVVGSEPVNGRTAWKLKSGKRTLWVDTATGVRLKALFGNGTMEVREFKPGKVDASRFTTASMPKSKIQAFDGQMYMSLGQAKQSAPWLKSPAQLPAGYSLESAMVNSNTAWLRYTDGRGRFSLFLQKAEEGEVKPQEQEGGWFWKKGGIRYFVTGAPEGSITAMADSVS